MNQITSTRGGRLRRSGAGVAIAVLMLGGAAACSSDKEPPPASVSSSTVEITPEMRLEAMKKYVDESSSVHLLLTSQDVPEGAMGITGADGVGTHAPAFKGTVKGKIDTGIFKFEGDAEATAVDGSVWVKAYGFQKEFSPEQLGIDPAALFTPDRGITTLLPATIDPQFGEQKRAGSDVLDTINGTLPGDKIVDLLKVGKRDGTFKVTYGSLEDKDELRQVELKGPFFGDTESTYLVTLDRYGETVEITRP